MTDSLDDTTASSVQDDGSRPSDVESPEELAVAVLWDGVIGAIAGAMGNVAILGTLLVAYLLGGFDPVSFGTVAEILGLGAVLSGNQLLVAGLIIFVVGGMTVLPLLLATLGMFLPGRRYATKGIVFGVAIWTGFVIAYYTGYSGTAVIVYLVASLVGHIAYGYVTGWTMDRLFAAEDRPVLAASITSPAAITERSDDLDTGVPRQETTLVDDVTDEDTDASK